MSKPSPAEGYICNLYYSRLKDPDDLQINQVPPIRQPLGPDLKAACDEVGVPFPVGLHPWTDRRSESAFNGEGGEGVRQGFTGR